MSRAPRGGPTRRSAWVDALALLARRDLSEGEVRTRLVRRGHDAEDVEGALARLRERRYLDDEALARSVASRRAEQRLQGPHRVRAHLRQRLIPEPMIDAAIRAAFPEGAEKARAVRVLERMPDAAPAPGALDDSGVRSEDAGFAEAQRVRARLVRRLVSRGFSFDSAWSAVEQHAAGGWAR